MQAIGSGSEPQSREPFVDLTRGDGINLARLDLVSVQLVVLCARTGSLSVASKVAHCALSTASHRLAVLEEAVRQPLFVRTGRGLRATAAGLAFVAHAEPILEHVNALRQHFR